MVRYSFLFLSLVLIFSGCLESEKPNKIAEKFWMATKAGHVEEAKKYLTKDSISLFTSDKDSFDFQGDIIFSEAKIDNNKAIVETNIKDASGLSIGLNTVMVKEDGKWKVDFNQTMMSMFGGALQGMVKGLGEAMMQGMNEAMKGMGEVMKENMNEAMKHAGDAMKESLKDMGKSLKEAEKETHQKAEVNPVITEAPAKQAPVEEAQEE